MGQAIYSVSVCDLQISIKMIMEISSDIYHVLLPIRSLIIPPPCVPTPSFATLNGLIFFPWSHSEPFPSQIRAETSLFWSGLS